MHNSTPHECARTLLPTSTTCECHPRVHSKHVHTHTHSHAHLRIPVKASQTVSTLGSSPSNETVLLQPTTFRLSVSHNGPPCIIALAWVGVILTGTPCGTARSSSCVNVDAVFASGPILAPLHVSASAYVSVSPQGVFL